MEATDPFEIPLNVQSLIDEAMQLRMLRDTPRKVALLREALRLSQIAKLAPFILATLFNALGNAIQQNALGDRRDNLEQSLVCFQEALQVYTIEQYPEEYAMTQNNLGVVYHFRISGERRDNLEQAITCFQHALQVRTFDEFPEGYATTQNNLGNAYQFRLEGIRRDNLEHAIRCYVEALRVYTIEAYAIQYASIQNNLGVTYRNRISGVRRDNLEHAIVCFQEALRVWVYEHYPEDYAVAQSNLGNTYQVRVVGRRRDNLEHAIECFQEALRISAIERYPERFARAQSNLGNTYAIRIAGIRRDNLEQAIVCQREALRVYIIEHYPEDYARTQNCLGTVYQNRIAGERQDNLEQALRCYQEALRVHTAAQHPEDYAGIQNNLGNLYGDRIIGVRKENLDQAVASYKEALQVYTLDHFPIEHRGTLLNLAWTWLHDVASEARLNDDPVVLQEIYASAHQAYDDAIRTQEELGWLEYDAQGHALLQGWTHSLREMYARGAWKLGNIQATIQTLEAGRVQALVEAQTLSGITLQGVCANHTEMFQEARENWNTARAAGGDVFAAHERVRTLRNVIIDHCQPDFLPGRPSWEMIAQAAAPGQALVFLVATHFSGLALVVPPDGGTPLGIELPRLTWPTVDNWLVRRDTEGRRVGGYQYALHHQALELLRLSAQYITDEQAKAQYLAMPLQEVPAALPPAFRTLCVALSQVIHGWQMEAERLELTSNSPQLQVAAQFRTHLTQSLDEAVYDSTLRRELRFFFLQAELDSLLIELSETFIGDLRQALDDAGLSNPEQEIALIPCGRLGVLPLHAAGARHDPQGNLIPFAETCVLSFQASARSLAVACQTVDRLPKTGPVIGAGDPTLKPKSHMKQLAWAEAEVEAILAVAKHAKRPTIGMYGDQATKSALLLALQDVRQSRSGALVQVAAHGNAKPGDLHQSYMVLAQEERLTLAELQRERLLEGVRLFDASGCQTAVLDLETAPDELGHFAGGLLQAGAASALATLWSVNDQATFLLMVRFMQYLLSDTTVSPARALRTAMHWLRTATHHDIALLKKAGMRGLKPIPVDGQGREVDEHRGAAAGEDETEERMSAEEALQELPRLSRYLPGPHPYDHPFFWASTVFYGA